MVALELGKDENGNTEEAVDQDNDEGGDKGLEEEEGCWGLVGLFAELVGVGGE